MMAFLLVVSDSLINPERFLSPRNLVNDLGSLRDVTIIRTTFIFGKEMISIYVYVLHSDTKISELI